MRADSFNPAKTLPVDPGTSSPSRRHPPGPWNMLGASGLTWRHALEMVVRPVAFSRRMADRYGDLVHFRLFGRRAYLVNHPELIAQILIHEADAFQRLPRQMKVIRQLFGDGLLVSEGEEWKTDRQMIQRAFDRDLSERSTRVTRECAEDAARKWSQLPQIELNREATLLAARISSRLFTGVDDVDTTNQLADAVIAISDVFSREMNAAVRFPTWWPTPSNRKKRRTLNQCFGLFDQLIARHRESCEESTDLLHYLLANSPPSKSPSVFARDQLLTLLIAAYHATSTAIVWIFHLLEQHPGVESDLLEDLKLHPVSHRGDMTSRDSYLHAVVAESLRLYPPAWALFARRSVQDVTMRGYRIPAGGWFYIFPILTHRSAAFFPDPMRFDPGRFLGSRKTTIPKYAWIPFGAGGRACIGNRLAMAQLQVLVGTLLESVVLRSAPGTRPPSAVAQLSLRPRNDWWVRAPRSPLKEFAAASCRQSETVSSSGRRSDQGTV